MIPPLISWLKRHRQSAQAFGGRWSTCDHIRTKGSFLLVTARLIIAFLYSSSTAQAIVLVGNIFVIIFTYVAVLLSPNLSLTPLTSRFVAVSLLRTRYAARQFNSRLVQTLSHCAARAIIAPRLAFSSYLILRLTVPLLTYLPLAMSYSLVSLAFNLPFGGK